ncbi:MAG: LAGLIDADG family homing endonuclease [Patescibacteria group bacterium]
MLTADYILGLTDGEGCFLVQLRTDCRVVLRYFITQRFDNRELLDKVFEFFKVGYVYRKFQGNDKQKMTYVYEVTRQSEVQDVIVPFFKKHSLQGVKKNSFERFAKVAAIVKNRQDTRKLTKGEVDEVWQLKLTMNTLHNQLKNISARPMREIRSSGGNVL